jgi:hypothetical protein
VVNCAGRFGNRGVWLAMIAISGALSGCTQPIGVGPSARLFAVDQAGAAKSCNVPAVTPVAGKDTPVVMKLANDGGWCAFAVNNAGKPYDAGLLLTAPAHGKVLIHTVGNDTRVDYTPAARYAGPDAFTVRLIPGDALLQASVTVTP